MQKSRSKYIQWSKDKNIFWKESEVFIAEKPLYSKYTKYQIMSSKKNNVFLEHPTYNLAEQEGICTLKTRAPQCLSFKQVFYAYFREGKRQLSSLTLFLNRVATTVGSLMM